MHNSKIVIAITIDKIEKMLTNQWSVIPSIEFSEMGTCHFMHCSCDIFRDNGLTIAGIRIYHILIRAESGNR